MASDVTYLSQRMDALSSARQPWDAAWADLAAHFLPTRYRDVGRNPSAEKQPVLLNGKLVDSTGILAMRTLAAGLQGGMTSPARPWFRLTLDDEELARSHGVGAWMDEVAKRMRNVFHRSNFYNAIHTVYAELGTFGTAFLMETADYASGFRFTPFTAGEYYLDIDASLRVDVVFRRFSMTARQMSEKFGESKLPDAVRSEMSRKGTATRDQYSVVHAIYPRHDYSTPSAIDPTTKPWSSAYWLDFSGASGSGGRGSKPHLLDEGGFEEFPGFGPRWDVSGNDVYGKSPAMDVLPDCRMLQQMGLTTLKAIHKAVDPPMSVAASLKSVGLDLTPGGQNFVDTAPGEAPQAAVPLIQARPDIQAARIAMSDVQQQIQQGLYNDLFRMLLGSNRSQITAREVAAREEEKLILIGPVLERLQDELFSPLITRTFNLMERMDMLPEPPPDIAKAPIKVEFVSLLAQAQRMVSTSGVNQFFGFVAGAAQAYPDALDAIDIDKMVDGYAEYLGVEVDMLRPLDDREAMRQQRAEAQAQAMQQAQAQQGMAQMGQLAGAAKTLSDTSTGSGSALEALVGGLGGVGV